MTDPNYQESLIVSVETLRRIANLAFDSLQALDADPIEMIYDLYWDLGYDQIYDVTKEPTNLGLGSLYENYELIQNTDAESIIPDALRWIASLLRAAADQWSSSR